MRYWPSRSSDKYDLLHKRNVFKFIFVGGVGFCIDGGLLTLLMQTGWGILPARLASFFSAVTSTWLLNRFWTFESGGRLGIRKEYASYIATQIVGALINLTVFFALIGQYPLLQGTPLIPLAFGAIISLAFNYTVSKKYIFMG